MADLKFKVVADLRKLEKDLSKVLNQKVSVEGAGGGAVAGPAGRAGKKRTSLLTKGVAALGVIAALLKTVQPVLDLIKIILSIVVLRIIQIAKFIFITLPGLLSTIWTKIVEWLKIGWAFIKALPKRIWEFLKALPARIWDFVKNLAVDIWNLLKLGFDFLKETLISWFTKVVDFIKGLAGAIWDKLKAGFEFVVEIFKTVGSFLKEKLILIGQKIKELAIKIKTRLIALGKKIGEKLSKLTEKFKEIIEGVKTKIGELKDKLSSILSNIKDKIFNLARDIASAIKSKIGSFLGGGGGEEQDFISRPGKAPVSFSPGDTIIGVKDPGMLGGGSKTINIFGSTNQEIIEIVKRELGVDVNRSTRL